MGCLSFVQHFLQSFRFIASWTKYRSQTRHSLVESHCANIPSDMNWSFVCVDLVSGSGIYSKYRCRGKTKGNIVLSILKYRTKIKLFEQSQLYFHFMCFTLTVFDHLFLAVHDCGHYRNLNVTLAFLIVIVTFYGRTKNDRERWQSCG